MAAQYPHRPDRFAWLVPFVPGAVLGAAIGMRIAVATTEAHVFWGATAAGALAVGAVSARYGWGFWDLVRHWGSRWL